MRLGLVVPVAGAMHVVVAGNIVKVSVVRNQLRRVVIEVRRVVVSGLTDRSRVRGLEGRLERTPIR